MISSYKIILIWYLALTALGVGGAFTLSVVDLFWGLILMWSCLFVFKLGANSVGGLRIASFGHAPKSEGALSVSLPLLAILSVPAGLYAAYFYTGADIYAVVRQLLGGESLYRSYQDYYMQAEIAQFSAAKIPAILTSAFLKFSLVYSFIRVCLIQHSRKRSDVCSLLVISLAYLYFSIARGTSFELFEIFLLLWMGLCFRQRKRTFSQFIRSKQFVFISVFSMVLLMFFNYSLSLRGDWACATQDLCIDESAVLYKISPSLGNISFNLSGYLTFGLFYSSTVISRIWLASPSSFIFGIFPYGFQFLSEASSFRTDVCGPLIDCGVAWRPDVMRIFFAAGFIGLMTITVFLGRQAMILYRSGVLQRNVVSACLLYFIILYMYSLPVGNFLFVSSSNTLVCAFFVIWHVGPRLVRACVIAPEAKEGKIVQG